MSRLTLKDLRLNKKRVLMRVDFNVPLSKTGEITDDSRIRATLPSIQYILNQGASLILMSHLGRPNGQKDPKLSLAPCAKRLSEILNQEVRLAPDCVGPEVEKLASALAPGEILLLENLRFHEGEEEPEKNPSFTSQLAKLGNVYVNDAFGTAHRAHASTALIAKYFPEKAATGFLMENEIEHLAPLLIDPEKPFYAIIGGAKISSKAGVIHNLLKRIDALFLGGGMTFTFLQAQGISIGSSLFESSEIRTAKEILSENKSIYLPSDIIIADAFENNANKKTVLSKDGIPAGWRGMDIGPRTIQEWSQLFQGASTIFWNGPLGVFEMPDFALGTKAIADALIESKAKVIIGGGDLVAAIRQMGLENSFSHLCTGGGAALEFLEFGHLPGIDALTQER